MKEATNTIEEIIERIQNSILSLESDKEDMDDASWNYQIGILLSGNDAKALLAEIEQEKAKTEILRKSLAHETTQRIFDNEKAKKLARALKVLQASINGGLDGLELDNSDDVVEKSEVIKTLKEHNELIEKALTEYKTK